jgi:type VII secretion integral membrane protein EccD
MTLPSTLPQPDADPDFESDSQPELTRVAVVVGAVQVDVGLPGDASVGAVVNDVVEFANAQLMLESERSFDITEGTWTLARLGAEPFDPARPVSDFDVHDGDLLVIRPLGVPCAPLLFDDVDDAALGGDRRDQMLREAPMVGSFAVAVIASITAAVVVAGQGSSAPQIIAALTVGAVGAIAACLLGFFALDAAASPWLATVAIPPIFVGAARIVTGGFTTTSLPVGFALTGLLALVALLTSGRGRAFYTAVIGLSSFGVATAMSVSFFPPGVRTGGPMLAVASVIVVYLAPRFTIVLSKLPVPPVPTAGEPLDDIETHGGTAIEGVNAVRKQHIPTEAGLIERVRPSNQYLTGIVVAATVAASMGSYLAVDVSNGFFWQGTAFAIVVATVLCLRGRSHYDLVQSATLIGGGLLTASAVVVKTAACLDGWRISAALALVVLMALIMVSGLIAPRLEFSPVMQRQAEIIEAIAIAMLFPLCFWIIRLYAYFRELSI